MNKSTIQRGHSSEEEEQEEQEEQEEERKSSSPLEFRLILCSSLDVLQIFLILIDARSEHSN
jgi:hypothetical protein